MARAQHLAVVPVHTVRPRAGPGGGPGRGRKRTQHLAVPARDVATAALPPVGARAAGVNVTATATDTPAGPPLESINLT